MESTQFPKHHLGLDANETAEKAQLTYEQISVLKAALKEFLEKNQDLASRSPATIITACVAVVIFIFCSIAEYQISAEIYEDFVGFSYRFLPALILIGFGIIAGAMIGERFYPHFSRHMQSSSISYSDTIKNRRKKQIPPNNWIVLGGILLAIILVGIVTVISFERLALKVAANEVSPTHLQKWGPPVLLLFDIISGVFLVFFINYTFYYFPRLNYYQWKISKSDKQFLALRVEAVEMWHCYTQELDIFNREQNQTQPPIQMSSSLKWLSDNFYSDGDDDDLEPSPEDDDPPPINQPPENRGAEEDRDSDNVIEQVEEDLFHEQDNINNDNNKYH